MLFKPPRPRRDEPEKWPPHLIRKLVLFVLHENPEGVSMIFVRNWLQDSIVRDITMQVVVRIMRSSKHRGQVRLVRKPSPAGVPFETCFVLEEGTRIKIEPLARKLRSALALLKDVRKNRGS